MPLVFNKIIGREIHLALWEITETEEDLRNNISLDWSDLNELNEISSPGKRLEYLASRLAVEITVKHLGGNFEGLVKDEHGKPFLRNNYWEISLSHSKTLVGVAVSKTESIGLDIEKTSDKILKIMPRLFTDSELEAANNDIDISTVFWSAKECLYKLYGKRQVDFKENLMLYFKGETLYGRVKMPNFDSEYKIWHQKINDFNVVLAY